MSGYYMDNNMKCVAWNVRRNKPKPQAELNDIAKNTPAKSHVTIGSMVKLLIAILLIYN